MGKGLGGGIPVGATIVTQKVGSVIFKGLQTSTLGGNPLACVGVITMLEKLNDLQLSHISEMGSYFVQQLNTINSPNIIEVRGAGLMIGVQVKENRNGILKKLQEKKILAIPGGETVVRFIAPFIVEKKHIDETVTQLKNAVS